MYELCVREKFSAAHHIRGITGPCARNHGHNWELRVYVRSHDLDQNDLAVDFIEIQKALHQLIERWDHRDLNELEEFKEKNPTAESLAKETYERMALLFANQKAWINHVTIWETDQCSATYYGRERH